MPNVFRAAADKAKDSLRKLADNDVGQRIVHKIQQSGEQPQVADSSSEDRAMNFVQAILYGLTAVHKRGLPGTVSQSGLKAFCLVANEKSQCVGGATEYGSGRVIALSHNSFLTSTTELNDQNHNAFSTQNRNFVAWAAHSESEYLTPGQSTFDFTHYPFGGGKSIIKVAGLGVNDQWLSTYVAELNKVGGPKFVQGAADKSAKAATKIIASNPDVIVWTNANLNDEMILNPGSTLDPRAEGLLRFVQSGGGLVVSVCPWGWESMTKGRANLSRGCLFNQVLQKTGLEFRGTYAGTAGGDSYDVKYTLNSPEQQMPYKTLIKVADQLVNPSMRNISKADFQKAWRYASDLPLSLWHGQSVHSSTMLPDEQEGFRGQVIGAVGNVATSRGLKNCHFPLDVSVNTDEVDADRAAAILFLLYYKYKSASTDVRQLNSLTVMHTPEFPGLVQGSTRLSNYLVSLNPYLGRWQNTGVYVPPGEYVTIEVSDQVLTAFPGLELEVRIDGHTDNLNTASFDKRGSIQRHPSVAARRHWKPQSGVQTDYLPINDFFGASSGQALAAGSVFGGPLYIGMKQKLDQAKRLESPLVLRINGGVNMVYTNLQRELAETPWSPQTDSYPHTMPWQQKLTTFNQAPWAELEGRYISMVVPYDAVMKIADPIAAISFWDAVEAHYLALTGQQLDGKERVVADHQISAGYMHAGYPIMTHMDIWSTKDGVPPILNLPKLNAAPSWGLYHELGHNRQQGVWTWSGLTEVTVNIFSLYATHMINGLSPYHSPYYVNNCRKQVGEFLASKTTTYKDWATTINTALGMYVMFIEEFGWKAIGDTFRLYLNGNIKANSDTDKIKEWVRQTSLATQADLRPFYRQWKWDIKDSDFPELNGLPPYRRNVIQVHSEN